MTDRNAPDPRASDVRAVLLAGGEGRRMGALGAGRLKPLIPFGGACRLADFSIANARASGLPEVLLLSQHEERQLMDDLYRVWWGPDFRVHFGPHDHAYLTAARNSALPGELAPTGAPPELGTADALIRKAPYIFSSNTAHVLVMHADHVYRFDYRDMIDSHRRSGAALTLSYQRIEREYVHLFGMVAFDDAGRLTEFTEKPAQPTSDLVFAAFCLFDAAVLHRYLELLDGTSWQHDISRDLIPAMLAAGEHIVGYPVSGYWEDIGTVRRYYRAHVALVEAPPTMSLAQMPWTLRPHLRRRYVEKDDGIWRSIVADDLVNGGQITKSVLFPGVTVGAGAQVRASILLPGASIPAGALVDRAIVTETGAVQDCRDDAVA